MICFDLLFAGLKPLISYVYFEQLERPPFDANLRYSGTAAQVLIFPLHKDNQTRPDRQTFATLFSRQGKVFFGGLERGGLV